MSESDKVIIQLVMQMTNYKSATVSRRRGNWITLMFTTLILLTFTTSVFGRGETGYDEKQGHVGGTKTLSAVNLLLPISTCNTCGRVKQEIKATNGCYQWDNSHPGLVSMTRQDGSSLDNSRQEQNECLESVIVEAAARKETKTLIWITAKDKNSGQVLRCAVKIGKPERFVINANFHQISLNDIQRMQIEAFDSEEGLFSNMDGFRFDWAITQGSDKVKKANVHQTDNTAGGRSDIFLVRGVSLGKATIRVRLLEPGYEEIQEQFIDVTVTEPFVLVPSHSVYIMPLCKFKFEIANLVFEDDGTLHHRTIKIPNSNYNWSADTSIGNIGPDGVFQSRVSKGTASIQIVDQRMLNNTAEGDINVVYPYRLEVKLRDVTHKKRTTPLQDSEQRQLNIQTENFAKQMFEAENEQELINAFSDTYILIEEHDYLLETFLYDAEGHLITLTDNLQFSAFNLDEDYISITKKNKIGSEILFKTKRILDSSIDSKTLQTIHKLEQMQIGDEISKFDETRIRADKEMIITRPVKIQHLMDYILLPFLPVSSTEAGEVWNTHATGGSGIYSWSMADSKIATVQGSAQIRSLSIGKTELVVRDHRNYFNWDSITVEVTNMHTFTWIEEQVELRASDVSKQGENVDGEERILSLVALDDQGRKFTNCTAVNPEYSIKGEGQISLVKDFFKQKTRYERIQSKYDYIRDFVKSSQNKPLLILKQRFDQSPNTIKSKDLPIDMITDERNQFGDESEDPLFYNNFGICSQTLVVSHQEGLARIKASFTVFEKLNGPSRILESSFAEIAVYQPLKTLGKKYKPFLADLYSTNQISQEFQSFEGFYNHEEEYHLNFGTHIIWSVMGGTNFWQDYTERYQYKWSTSLKDSDLSADSVISAQKHFESTTLFAMKVGCKNQLSALSESQKTKISLQQSSYQTKHLLRPATHSTSIAIHCDAPSSLKLNWAQQNRSEDQEGNFRAPRHLPRSRIVKNERTHYVLVNSEHYIRTLLLNENQYVSLNNTSLAVKVRPSDDKMANVYYTLQGDKDEGFLHYQHASELEIYDKRRIQFKDITGTMFIESQSEGYFNKVLNDVSSSTLSKASGPKPAVEKDGSMFGSIFGKEKPQKSQESISASEAAADYFSFIGGAITKLPQGIISNRMKVEVVRNVDVEPKYKSLYLGLGVQTYKLDLMFGSGHFSVSLNNTSIAELQHKDREVFITPKELGSIEIRVEDLEIPDSVIATSEILISDIHRLTLWAPRTLIEQGDQLELTVSAFDNHLAEFDQDQYDLMNFKIEAEMTGVIKESGLKAIQTVQSNRMFEAKGIEPGIYQIVATTLRHNYIKLQSSGQDKQSHKFQTEDIRMTIVSEMLRLEVFPLLEVIPKELLITPNMRYTLQIVGGPQNTRSAQNDGSHVEIRFEIEQNDIATVDSFREVTGHQVGDALLKYEIIQLKTSLPPMIGTSPYNLQTNQQAAELSKVVSKRTVRIRVRLVTDIEIPFTHQRQIYSHSYIKVQAVLKFNEEYFNHGIAPLSYNWNCTQARVLNLDLPSKQELAASLGIESHFVMAQKAIRDGLRNDNNRYFFSAFNSSSIYATALHEGDALLRVQLAIEYPELYKNEQNWFDTDANVKVVEKLSIDVPEYSQQDLRQTSLYLLPPNTVSKITTNRRTKLNLGYSTEAVFDPVTRKYRYQESSSPIISLINDDSIRTYDKFGKVTVIVAESQTFSDQVAMLNVLIQDVFAIASMKTYDALSLPLGSSMTLPINFQDEHGHRFAQNIEGLNVEFVLSHPRVVMVELDHFNQTITLISQGSGDCNIVMYMADRPHIFDVIRVRVSSIVKPLSPVFLHLGGEVEFRVASTDSHMVDDHKVNDNQNRPRWSSSNPFMLQISANSGKAKGLSEGRADVLLSNHVNAASIVHVRKVQSGVIEQIGPMLINTDNGGTTSTSYGSSDDLKVRVKFFLDKQGDELMPTVQFDGITLIRQNVAINCESDQPQWIQARGEISDLEGYFCVMNYVGGSGAKLENMPRYVKIKVSASADNIYSQVVTQFEVQLTSSIKIETRYRSGQIKLNRNNRTQVIKVFSGSDFNVKFEYDSSEEGSLIKHQVTREREDQNEYKLTLTIPNQVSHNFEAKVILSHPFAKEAKTLSLSFTADDIEPIRLSQNSQVRQEPYEEKPKIAEEQKVESGRNKETSFFTYFVFIMFTILIGLFLMSNVFGVHPKDLFGGKKSKSKDVSPSILSRPKQNIGYQADGGIRERRVYQNSFSSYGGKVAGASQRTDYNDLTGRDRSRSYKGFQPLDNRAQNGMHLDQADYSRDSARRSLGKSIYSNIDDRSGFY